MMPTVARRAAALTAAAVAVVVTAACAAVPEASPVPAEHVAVAQRLGVAPFAGPGNTGVPPGTELTPYDGPCEITVAGTVIDAKTVTCALDVRAAGVVVSRSLLGDGIRLDTDRPGARGWSYTVQDSEIDGGTAQLAAVGWGNMIVLRSEVRGGATSVQCWSSAVSCVVRDSWLHGQYLPPDDDWHLGGFLSNGGSNIELTGNTIVCDAVPNAVDGGCTGNLNLIPDFAVIENVRIVGNLLGAGPGGAYCTYGGDVATKPFPDANNVVYRDNVFERGPTGQCATYGPVTAFDVDGVGNVWVNNRWDDGTPVIPTL
ncbi:MAG: hypothetical protein ACT4RN_19845 [Pseudonocardia sp.]